MALDNDFPRFVNRTRTCYNDDNMKEKDDLEKSALQARAQVLRMIRVARSGHLAGSLSGIDVMTYFYRRVLNVKPDEPAWDGRDRFLLSAGHVCPAWYAVLSERGFINPEQLLTLRQLGSPLQGHPRRDVSLGIENSAGSLGQGVSLAAGIALALQRGGGSQRVFVYSSDGEQDEGMVWEAYLFASHYHLGNLTVIIDVNGIQQSGATCEVLDLGDLSGKLRAFGWAVEKCDGHDFSDIEAKYSKLNKISDRPRALLCRTIPGKGISLLEADAHWHAGQPSEEGWRAIFGELAGKLEAAGVSL